VGRAVVDATVVIAFADTEDEEHERGAEIVREIDHGHLVTGVIVHEALLEILNFLNERKGHRKAAALLELLEESAHYRLPPNPTGNTGVGRGLFRHRSALSLGDAMQVAFMRSEGIEYVYSFDDDFDTIPEITRLNAAENPFV